MKRIRKTARKESDITWYLLKAVFEKDGLCRKVKWENRNGAPDWLVLLPGGKSVFVELKAPGKKPSKQQKIEHALLRRIGQQVLVIDSYAQIDSLFDNV